MINRKIIPALAVMSGCAFSAMAGKNPNIVFILADDMGCGDVACLNAESKIPTPHLDALAAGGLTLTDAHTSSAVCTPSRYSIMTGRYCWRSKMKRGVLGGYSPALIEPGRETMASVLKNQGYNTACIGKWHLGMDLKTTDGKKPGQSGEEGGYHCNLDWQAPIKNSPTSNGFDYFFGIAGSLDMPPYVYVENEHFIGAGTETKAFHRPGPALPAFEAYKVMDELTAKVTGYIAKQTAQKPFFIYFAMTAPHNPRSPNKEFQGKSGIGPYPDLCMEVDHHVGQVMAALKAQGLARNTLVVFTSDNGCENLAYEQLKTTGHSSCGVFRGVKRDLWEGGHRVPTFVSWPGKITANTCSDETICLTDFMPTFAELTGYSMPDNAAEDGVSLLKLLKGESFKKPLRDGTVHHSLHGDFAIRQGDWVFIDAPDGDDRGTEPDWFKEMRGYTSHPYPGELFNLAEDLSEHKNLYGTCPERVQQMKALLEKYKSSNRSTGLTP